MPLKSGVHVTADSVRKEQNMRVLQKAMKSVVELRKECQLKRDICKEWEAGYIEVLTATVAALR